MVGLELALAVALDDWSGVVFGAGTREGDWVGLGLAADLRRGEWFCMAEAEWEPCGRVLLLLLDEVVESRT